MDWVLHSSPGVSSLDIAPHLILTGGQAVIDFAMDKVKEPHDGARVTLSWSIEDPSGNPVMVRSVHLAEAIRKHCAVRVRIVARRSRR